MTESWKTFFWYQEFWGVQSRPGVGSSSPSKALQNILLLKSRRGHWTHACFSEAGHRRDTCRCYVSRWTRLSQCGCQSERRQHSCYRSLRLVNTGRPRFTRESGRLTSPLISWLACPAVLRERTENSFSSLSFRSPDQAGYVPETSNTANCKFRLVSWLSKVTWTAHMSFLLLYIKIIIENSGCFFFVPYNGGIYLHNLKVTRILPNIMPPFQVIGKKEKGKWERGKV